MDSEKPISPAAGALPSYEATEKVDQPPTYQSLYSQMKDTKEKNPNPVSFLYALSALLMGTLCVTVLMALVLAIPITMIVIGAIYKDDCPAEYLIPIYLIVMGSVYVFKSLMDLKIRVQRSRLPPEERENFQPTKVESCLNNLIGLFCFAFFIAGNVWIYRIYAPDTSQPSSQDYCHPILYYFSFWVTTAVYIFMALSCCCFCGTACLVSNR